MPIANCYIPGNQLSQINLQKLAEEWANDITVDIDDICLTAITDYVQAGRQYGVMINLFLPSLWPDSDVERIQKSLLNQFVKRLDIEVSDVFIITSIVPSGKVVENGGIVKW